MPLPSNMGCSKYLQLSFVTVMLSILLYSNPALAYEQKTIELDPGNKLAQNSKLGTMGNIEQGGGAVNTAAKTINLLLGLLGTLCLALMFYAGYLWLAAEGREEDITKAKGIITGTILGMLVVLASYSFMYFVFRNIINATD